MFLRSLSACCGFAPASNRSASETLGRPTPSASRSEPGQRPVVDEGAPTSERLAGCGASGLASVGPAGTPHASAVAWAWHEDSPATGTPPGAPTSVTEQDASVGSYSWGCDSDGIRDCASSSAHSEEQAAATAFALLAVSTCWERGVPVASATGSSAATTLDSPGCSSLPTFRLPRIMRQSACKRSERNRHVEDVNGISTQLAWQPLPRNCSPVPVNPRSHHATLFNYRHERKRHFPTLRPHAPQ